MPAPNREIELTPEDEREGAARRLASQYLELDPERNYDWGGGANREPQSFQRDYRPEPVRDIAANDPSEIVRQNPYDPSQVTKPPIVLPEQRVEGTVPEPPPGADMGYGAGAAGEWIPASHETKVQRGFGPEETTPAKNAAGMALIHEEEAARKQVEINAKMGEAQANYATQAKVAEEVTAARLAKMNQARDAYVNRRIRQVEADTAALRNSPRSAQEYFAADGNMGAFMGVLGTAMSAIGQGLMRQGGPNPFLANVDRQISAELQAQDKNIDNQITLLKLNEEKYGSREKAILASKAQMLGMASAELAKAKAAAETPQAAAGLEQALAGIEKERGKYLTDFAKLEHNDATEMFGERFKPPAPVGPPGGGQVLGDEPGPETWVPDMHGHALTEKDADKLKADNALAKRIDETYKEAIPLFEEMRQLHPTSIENIKRMYAIQKRIEILQNRALTMINVDEKQGAISSGDEWRSKVQAGFGGKLDLYINPLNKIQQQTMTYARGDTLGGMGITSESYGIRRGKLGYVQTPTGPKTVGTLKGENRAVHGPTDNPDRLLSPVTGQPKQNENRSDQTLSPEEKAQVYARQQLEAAAKKKHGHKKKNED